MTTTPPHSAPLIRQFALADWFTLANAACGAGAIFSMMTYLEVRHVRHIYFAGGLVAMALLFDFLDGRIARWRQKTSTMGRELDSLSDVISFGVAPAMMAYGCGMQGLYDRLVLIYFVVCGVSRLARYNVTAEALSGDDDKVKHFEGTPIPTSIVLVLVLLGAAACGAVGEDLPLGRVEIGGFQLHLLVLLFAISGTLMISRVRVPKP
jgi:CDP-diacylglycerol--serine O-phosphatidyltransferase